MSRRFGRQLAVDRLDLELQPGEVLGLLGPTGSGKSTTLRLLLGLLAPSDGVVELFGGPPDVGRRRRVGYLPEQRALHDDMRAVDQLAWSGQLHGVARAVAIERAERWLERMGLGGRGRERLDAFAEGLQQRVQLGTTVLHAPELLVLDEPCRGLDPIGQDLLAGVVREQAAAGVGVLVCADELAERVCDRIAVLVRGRLILEARVDELARGRGTLHDQIVASIGAARR